jgi:hypothetical protein
MRWTALGLFGAALVIGCSANDSGGGSGGGGGSAGSGATGTGAGSGSGGATGTGASGGSGGGSAPGEIGDPCSTDADCTAVAGAECWTTIGGGPVPSITFPGGFCSKACDTGSSDKECGEIAACASIGVSGGQGSVTLTMCTPPCSQDSECRQAEGYRCQVILPPYGFCTL